MTDDLFNPPFGGEDDKNRDRALPEHEYDRDDAVGGGVMGSGGTSVDRGTGELAGSARGDEDVDEDDMHGVNEGMIAGMPAGGAQSYVPAFVEDDDEEGGSLPGA